MIVHLSTRVKNLISASFRILCEDLECRRGPLDPGEANGLTCRIDVVVW